MLDKIANFFVSLFNGAIDWVLELLNSFVLDIATFISNWLVGKGLSIEIPSGVFDVLSDLTRSIGYILPLSALTPIISFMLSFYVIKIIFSIYRIIASTTIKRVSVKV